MRKENNNNILKRRYKLSQKYSIEMSMSINTTPGTVTELNCLWDPYIPSKTKLNKLYDRYLNARESFMKELATIMDGSVATIELDGDVYVSEPATKH